MQQEDKLARDTKVKKCKDKGQRRTRKTRRTRKKEKYLIKTRYPARRPARDTKKPTVSKMNLQ